MNTVTENTEELTTAEVTEIVEIFGWLKALEIIGTFDVAAPVSVHGGLKWSLLDASGSLFINRTGFELLKAEWWIVDEEIDCTDAIINFNNGGYASLTVVDVDGPAAFWSVTNGPEGLEIFDDSVVGLRCSYLLDCGEHDHEDFNPMTILPGAVGMVYPFFTESSKPCECITEDGEEVCCGECGL